MTTIASRLAAIGVWGMTPESYHKSLVPSCVGNLLPPGANPATPDEFWDIARCSVAGGYAWGKHPEDSITTDEGAWGRQGQVLACQNLHGTRGNLAEMRAWTNTLDSYECVTHLPGFKPFTDPEVRFGGWAQWPSGKIRGELFRFKYVLCNARNYDDYGWSSIIEGLCCCLAAVENLIGNDGDFIRDTARTLLDDAIREALADAEHAGGLGLAHDPITRDIQACRDHEPAMVSTDSTASLVWALTVAYATTQYRPWLDHAEKWRSKVQEMRSGNGKWYPFVNQYAGVWHPVGRDERFRIMRSTVSVWPIPGKAEYQRGIPPTTSVPAVLARVDAAMKGLVP